MLWSKLIENLCFLRNSTSRRATFEYLSLGILGMCSRLDTSGVASFMRSLFLRSEAYQPLVRSFQSESVDLGKMQSSWVEKTEDLFGDKMLRVRGRKVYVGDGIKVPKEGRRMPGVKSLHQLSSNNSKPPYIMGHSCQSISILVENGTSIVAVPLGSEIHEGAVFSNRDTRTLIDKFASLFSRTVAEEPSYLLADAYYNSGALARALMEELDCHLVSRVDSNAVAFEAPEPQPSGKRGRKPKYGRKLKLLDLFQSEPLSQVTLEIYGNKSIFQFWTKKLYWKSFGGYARFVGCRDEAGRKIVLVTTDMDATAEELIRLYSLRMKIEVSFKPAVHDLGAYSYRFWQKDLKKNRRGDGDRFFHRAKKRTRQAAKKKLKAYQAHILTGVIAQGMLQYLSLNHRDQVLTAFPGWIRTLRPGCALSEQIVMESLRGEYLEFLHTEAGSTPLGKFILSKVDLHRTGAFEKAMGQKAA